MMRKMRWRKKEDAAVKAKEKEEDVIGAKL